jgi:hypothetical protein
MMKGCNCHSGLGALQVDVSGADCPWGFYLDPPRAIGNPGVAPPTLLETLRHDLCLARNFVVQGWDKFEDWVKSLLVDLETEFASLWSALKNGATTVWGWVKDLGSRVKQFVQWLDAQIGTAETWLLIVGVGILLYSLSPAINTAAAHYSRKRAA